MILVVAGFTVILVKLTKSDTLASPIPVKRFADPAFTERFALAVSKSKLNVLYLGE
jgi:hypothetical protein